MSSTTPAQAIPHSNSYLMHGLNGIVTYFFIALKWPIIIEVLNCLIRILLISEPYILLHTMNLYIRFDHIFHVLNEQPIVQTNFEHSKLSKTNFMTF